MWLRGVSTGLGAANGCNLLIDTLPVFFFFAMIKAVTFPLCAEVLANHPAFRSTQAIRAAAASRGVMGLPKCDDYVRGDTAPMTSGSLSPSAGKI